MQKKHKFNTPVSYSHAEYDKTYSGVANLLRAIFGKFPREDLHKIDAVLAYRVLSTLTQKEELVIRKRFGIDCGKQTLESIGQEFDVCRERVRQKEQKALRKLRHPSRMGQLYLLFATKDELRRGIDRLKAKSEKYHEENRELKIKLHKERKAHIETLERYGAPCGIISALKGETKIFPPAMSIEELQLSLRAHNCLTRANIWTVADLTEKTESEIQKLRNLGRKSFEEIRAKLNSMGLSLKPE